MNQAHNLESMMKSPRKTTAKFIAVTSGKGGVGIKWAIALGFLMRILG